jgi:protein gp37
MSEYSSIEWTDSTFNPWIGCTKVGPGCDHCYAERDMDHRRGRAKWGAGQPRSRTSFEYWRQPLRWNAVQWWSCPACGWRGPDSKVATAGLGHAACPTCPSPRPALEFARQRVFCASLADVFDNEVDAEWRRDLFDLIRATPRLDWLLLTKRIGIAERLARAAADGRCTWPENVWLGATVVNQEEVDRDVPKLLATSARVRFLSVEPMLGPVDLTRVAVEGLRLPTEGGQGYIDALDPRNEDRYYEAPSRVDWVICGGESGPQARPMQIAWARSLRDQCVATSTPFLFKQWGEWAPALSGMFFDPLVDGPSFRGRAAGKDTHDFGNGAGAVRIGKKAAGRLFDGVEHNGAPV